jgi:hypothetical protein
MKMLTIVATALLAMTEAGSAAGWRCLCDHGPHTGVGAPMELHANLPVGNMASSSERSPAFFFSFGLWPANVATTTRSGG